MSENEITESDDTLVGQSLGDRYEIREELDRGGMGTVYLAQDLKFDRPVVVKIPYREMMVDKTFRERFNREILEVATHEHPGVVHIQDAGTHDGLPYLVVQYLRGGNLREKIAQQGGRQTHAQVMEWLPTIASALDTVHRNQSLHRDVKPANILFDEHGNAVLSDFGIATAIGVADPDAPTQEVTDLTVHGGFIGSVHYAPPEAIDRDLTPAYDQYSLATVVYLALTGEHPFTGATNEAVLVAKDKGVLTKIDRKRLVEPISSASEKALMKALSRRNADRFPTCADFAAAFGDVRLPATKSASWKPAAAALSAVLAGVAILGWFWTGPTDPDGAAEGDNKVAVAASNQKWPAVVQLGSNEEEIDRAIALCKQGGGRGEECARSIFSDERLRTVTLTAFEIDPTEVTNAEFAQFVQAESYRTTADQRGYSWDITKCRTCTWQTPRPNRRAAEHPDDPVVHVSWADARAFCQWRGARLPSENEWEFTARGLDRRTYPWGDEWDASRLRDPNSATIGLEPVGSHPRGANPDGVLDLAGSVWEWTSTTSGEGERRIFKGGSWMDRIPAYFRSAAFSEDAPDYSSINLGFRCARDL